MNEKTEVPVEWDALEDAFENNAAEVHSYLHLITGEVVRIVDGVADPRMHARIAKSREYLRVDAVPSREQYRWMEEFVDDLKDQDIADELSEAIDGKGAFRRFKDVLVRYPEERERWFSFRSERLRRDIATWLKTHNIVAVERPSWSGEDPESDTEERSPENDLMKKSLHDLIDQLQPGHFMAARSYLEFLMLTEPPKLEEPASENAPAAVNTEIKNKT